jgi:hypothetical protein
MCYIDGQKSKYSLIPALPGSPLVTESFQLTLQNPFRYCCTSTSPLGVSAFAKLVAESSDCAPPQFSHKIFCYSTWRRHSSLTDMQTLWLHFSPCSQVLHPITHAHHGTAGRNSQSSLTWPFLVTSLIIVVTNATTASPTSQSLKGCAPLNERTSHPTNVSEIVLFPSSVSYVRNHVVWYVDTNISKQSAASTFRAEL